ncbi:MAG: hypothetical protein P4L53_18020 [Candidatus Obscuribacterales bacterium]|jgi:hypothetical protein|nr:hypothetical protein [Candidatus Obscuribacterales bacterium]
MNTTKPLRRQDWTVSNDNVTTQFPNHDAAKIYVATLINQGKIMKRIHQEQRLIELISPKDSGYL